MKIMVEIDIKAGDNKSIASAMISEIIAEGLDHSEIDPLITRNISWIFPHQQTQKGDCDGNI